MHVTDNTHAPVLVPARWCIPTAAAACREQKLAKCSLLTDTAHLLLCFAKGARDGRTDDAVVADEYVAGVAVGLEQPGAGASQCMAGPCT